MIFRTLPFTSIPWYLFLWTFSWYHFPQPYQSLWEWSCLASWLELDLVGALAKPWYFCSQGESVPTWTGPSLVSSLELMLLLERVHLQVIFFFPSIAITICLFIRRRISDVLSLEIPFHIILSLSLSLASLSHTPSLYLSNSFRRSNWSTVFSRDRTWNDGSNDSFVTSPRRSHCFEPCCTSPWSFNLWDFDRVEKATTSSNHDPKIISCSQSSCSRFHGSRNFVRLAQLYLPILETFVGQ